MNQQPKALLVALIASLLHCGAQAEHLVRWVDSNQSATCDPERFDKPEALAVDSDGNLFVGESGGSAAIEALAVTGERRVVLRAGEFARGAQGIRFALNGRNELLIVTAKDDQIFKLNRSSSGLSTTLSPIAMTLSSDRGKLVGIAAIASNPNGDVTYIRGRLVMRVDGQGAVHLVAGNKSKAVSANGRGANASFTSPQDVIVLPGSQLLVADGGDLDAEGKSYAFGVLRAIDRLGNVSTFAGAYDYADTGNIDGPKVDARMPYLRGIARLRDGSIVLIEDQVATVRVIDPDGLVSTLFGQDRKELKRAELSSIAVDRFDNIYFSDVASGSVYKATTSGSLYKLCSQSGKVGGFNRSMQHTNHRVGGRSVADEATAKNLLFRQPEGADVGALEGRLDAAGDRKALRSAAHVDSADPRQDRRYSAS